MRDDLWLTLANNSSTLQPKPDPAGSGASSRGSRFYTGQVLRKSHTERALSDNDRLPTDNPVPDARNDPEPILNGLPGHQE